MLEGLENTTRFGPSVETHIGSGCRAAEETAPGQFGEDEPLTAAPLIIVCRWECTVHGRWAT